MLTAGVKIRDEGLHPAIPDSTPQFLRNLLSQCFQYQEKDRPSFDYICEVLKRNV
jgi:hypothetical protein